jgi:hypothetical protein
VVVCVDELADDDALAGVCVAGLVEARVAFGLAFWLAAGVAVAQLVPVAWPVGVLLGLGLEDAVAVALLLALALPVALTLALSLELALALSLELALTLSVGLPAEPLLPLAGLAGGLAGGGDEMLGELDGLDAGGGEAAAEDSGHITGVGRWCLAAAVLAPAATPRGLPPPPPADPGLDALVVPWPFSTLDTDELSAWRSGGTEARTTPTAKTAQPRAMAGLSSASRQSLLCHLA